MGRPNSSTEVVIVRLTQGVCALLDKEDWDYMRQWRWHACKGGNAWYMKRRGRDVNTNKQTHIWAHREIATHLGWNIENYDIDHINILPLESKLIDNRRANLRSVSHRQNILNSRKRKGSSSKFKGVCWNKRTGKWVVHATSSLTHKSKSLGSYSDEAEAARVYDSAVVMEYGNFGVLNFPEEWE